MNVVQRTGSTNEHFQSAVSVNEHSVEAERLYGTGRPRRTGVRIPVLADRSSGINRTNVLKFWTISLTLRCLSFPTLTALRGRVDQQHQYENYYKNQRIQSPAISGELVGDSG